MKCVNIGNGVTTEKTIRIAVGLGLSLPLLLAAPAALADLNLGPAADFAVFQMGVPGTGGGAWLSAEVTINGDVAFLSTMPGGNHLTTVNGNVQGTIPSADFAAKNWTVSGAYSQVPASTLLGFAATAQAFSADAANFTALPNIGDVSSATTYTFTAANLAQLGTYIVNAASIGLSGNDNLTLDGSDLPAGSRVIVNVANNFRLNGGASIVLAGGLTPAQVLINYTGTGNDNVTGGSGIAGTFLGPNSTASFTSILGVIQGSVIAEDVNLSSKLTINGIPFIPEPSTYIAGLLLLLPFGASALRIVRKRETSNLMPA